MKVECLPSRQRLLAQVAGNTKGIAATTERLQVRYAITAAHCDRLDVVLGGSAAIEARIRNAASNAGAKEVMKRPPLRVRVASFEPGSS